MFRFKSTPPPLFLKTQAKKISLDWDQPTPLGGRRTMRGTPGREPHIPYQIPNITYQIWNFHISQVKVSWLYITL